MAALTTIALVGLAVGTVGTIASMSQQRKAAKAAEQSSAWQENSQAEQSAANARESAIARRQAIREERVKRALILQASETAGTSGSSGEVGALGGMSTQLGSNMGTSQGMVMQGQRISFNNQAASNWGAKAGTYQNRSNAYQQLGNFGFGVMQQAGAQGRAGKQTFSLF